MANIAYADVTFTIVGNAPAGNTSGKPQTRRLGDSTSLRWTEATVAFGDGVKTYPSGGIPLSGGTLPFGMGGGTEPTRAAVALACPHVLQELEILGNDAGVPQQGGWWDKTTNTIRLGKPGTSPHFTTELVSGVDVVDAVTFRVIATGW